MAGEEEVLDMSLFNIDHVADTKEETKETIEEVATEQEPIDSDINIKDQADDGSQEIVGSQESESIENEEDTTEETTESPANSDDEVFKTFGAYLKEQGVLSTLDTDVNSLEEFAEAINKEVKDREFSSLTDSQKDYLTAMSKGVSTELYAKHAQSAVVYNNLTDTVIEEREDVRKEVIIQDLLSQGWTEDRAKRQYQRVFDLGESVEEAKISRDNLRKQESKAYEQEALIEQNKKASIKQAEEKRIKDLKQSVYDKSDMFDTFKVNDGLKDRVHKAMTNVVGYTDSGVALNVLMKDRIDNPVEFETNLYYLYEITNGFKDIKKFTTKANTIAANKVREAVTNSSLFKTSSANNFEQKGPTIQGSQIIDIE